MPVPAFADYPAAHSMDTEWFCVDAHGRVARFDTGEDGALPNAAAVGLSPGDASFDVELLEITRLANVLGRGRDPRPVAANGSAFAPTAGRQVIVVDDAVLARELIGTGELLVVRGEAPTVLLTRDDVDVEQARALAVRAGVRWVASTADLFELLEDSEGDDGLFHFQCEDGEKPGLYTRAAVPTHALTLDGLPAAIRSEIGNLVLPVDFAADATVQLSAHLADSEVSTWSELPLDNLADQEVEPLLPPGQTTSSLLIMTVVVLVLVALLFWVVR